MSDRREFIRQSAVATALIAAHMRGGTLWQLPEIGMLTDGRPPGTELLEDPPAIKELLHAALNAAQGAGAEYADARVQRLQQNFVLTREQQITNVVDTDTLGCGVRALVDGTWGFAATHTLTPDGVAAAAQR